MTSYYKGLFLNMEQCRVLDRFDVYGVHATKLMHGLNCVCASRNACAYGRYNPSHLYSLVTVFLPILQARLQNF